MSIRFTHKMILGFAVAGTLAAGPLPAVLQAAPTFDKWLTPGANTTWNNTANWASGIPQNDTSTNIAEFVGPITNQPNAGTTKIAGIQIGDGTTTTTAVTLSGTQLTIGGSATGGTGINMLAGAANSTISSPITLDSDQVWTNSSAANLTVGAGAITAGGNSLTLTNSGTSTATLTVSGAMSGLDNLTVNNSNTGTGNLFITGAITGNGSGTLAINNSATGASTGFPTFNPIQISGSINGFAALTINDTNAVAADGGIYLTGAISNVGGLTVDAGINTVNMAGTAANSYTGLTTVTSGILVVGSKASNLGNGGSMIVGDILIAGGTLVDGQDEISDTSNVTVSSGTYSSARTGFDTIGSLTMTGGTEGVATGGFQAGGVQIAGSAPITLSNAATMGAVNVLTSTGGVSLSNTASITSHLFLQGDVSTSGATGAGTTLGSVWLDGPRTFNVLSNAAVDLTVTGTITDGSVAGSSLTIAGGGVVKLSGVSNFTGGLNIANGKVLAGATNAFPLLGEVSLGGTGSTGTLDLNGFSIQIGGLANGSGANASNQVVTNSGGAKVLTIDTTLGSSTFGGTLTATTPANLAITKVNANTQTFTGTVTYKGATTVDGGVLEFVGQPTSVTPSLGTIGFGVGDGTVQSTYNATPSGQITGLTFSALGTRGSGATGNFVASGGTSGVVGGTNNIIVTGATHSAALGGTSIAAYYFNGANYAYVDATGFLRAPVYGAGGDTNFIVPTAGASLPSSSGANYQVSSSIASQTTASVLTIQFTGTGATDMTLADSPPGTPPVLTYATGGGFLRSGGGSTLISSADSAATIVGTINAELIIRTDSATDTMNIGVNVVNAASGSNALTKTGAGTLTLTGTNTYAGKTSVSGGTLVAGSANALGATGGGVQLNGGALDIATDSTINQYNITLNANSTILSDKATAGTGGITQQLGTLSLVNTFILTTGSGAHVTDNAAGLSFSAATITGTGAAPTLNNLMSTPLTLGSLAIGGQTLNATGTGANSIAITGSVVATVNVSSLLNPTTTNFTIGNITTSGTAKTASVQLGGTSTGNTISGGITDSGAGAVVSITKVSSGTWALSGTSTYTGATSILDGNLEVLGTVTGTSSVSVGTATGFPSLNTHPTLSGNGSITSGTVTLEGGSQYNSTGHIAPGVIGTAPTTLSAGTLTLGALTFLALQYQYAPVLDYTFVTPGTAGSALSVNTAINVTGAVNLNVSNGMQLFNTITLNLVDGPSAPSGPGAYQILTYGNVSAGTFAGLNFNFTGFTGYNGLTVINDGAGTGPTHGIWVTFTSFDGTAVPEPASLTLLGMGAAGLLLRRRRR